MRSLENLGNSIREYGADGESRWNPFLRAYRRFFEGYSETFAMKPNGKGIGIRRVYTGNYYCQNLSRSNRVLVRFLYVALFVCAVFLYVSSAVLPITGNSTWYVALAEAIALPFLFWILIAFIFYLPAPKKMTSANYRSSSLSLLKAALDSTVGLGLIAFATLAFIIVVPGDHTAEELLCAAKYAVGGLATFAIYRIEKSMKYSTIPSGKAIPSDAIEIH